MAVGALLLGIGLLGLLTSPAQGNIYLTNPRGANNRLNEQSANRQNANRLYDTQNNNRGGHNIGDRFDTPANDPRRQYAMQYYASGPTLAEQSKMIVEWTNQHGCGGNTDSPHKINCNIVIQMMCMTNGTDSDYSEKNSYLRDGINTNQQNYQSPNKNEIEGDDWTTKNANYDNRMNGKSMIDLNRGLHETVWWYDMCKYREANGGLYTANQNVQTSSLGYITSSATRQNPGKTRRGYECPEERDYYPYWQPTHQSDAYVADTQRTPWIDVAYLSGNTTDCARVEKNTENQVGKYRCVPPSESSRRYSRYINEADCTKHGGSWVMFQGYLEVIEAADTEAKCNDYKSLDQRNTITWMPLRSDSTESKCVVQAPKPKCGQAPWTRVNHLGNSIDNQGNASRLEIDMPYFPSGVSKRCVLRIRYNITSDEFDNYGTDSDQNDDHVNGVVCPAENNPFLDVSGMGKPLTLAINTAQYGRTFQDRTHVFIILPRTSAMSGKVINNLNVRGKRGNIVQTFPGVVYDFIPNKLTISEDELLHIQWTGSNTHNNLSPAGDGEPGDAGAGTGGTDRHNFLQIARLDLNYPIPYENSTFWEMVESLHHPDASALDLAIDFATSGYFCGYSSHSGCEAADTVSASTKAGFNNLLNNAPASYFGHVLRFKKSGTCVYMSTRNNNFANRSQKGILWVTPKAA